jgi:hypothetical protein
MQLSRMPSPWALRDKGTKELSCRVSLIASIRLSDRSCRVWNETLRDDSMPCFVHSRLQCGWCMRVYLWSDALHVSFWRLDDGTMTSHTRGLTTVCIHVCLTKQQLHTITIAWSDRSRQILVTQLITDYQKGPTVASCRL